MPMASEEKFTDRCLGVIVGAGGAGEQVGVATADGAWGEPHCCGGQIHGLIQDADVFQDQGVGDCGVLPSKSPKPCVKINNTCRFWVGIPVASPAPPRSAATWA